MKFAVPSIAALLQHSAQTRSFQFLSSFSRRGKKEASTQNQQASFATKFVF
jgi:hypothetical protein